MNKNDDIKNDGDINIEQPKNLDKLNHNIPINPDLNISEEMIVGESEQPKLELNKTNKESNKIEIEENKAQIKQKLPKTAISSVSILSTAILGLASIFVSKKRK